MSFADSYLSKHQHDEIDLGNPCAVVVIPCFNEPNLDKLIRELSLCHDPKCEIGILVVINSPETATLEELAQNKNSLEIVSEMKEIMPRWLKMDALEKEKLPKKFAGVGWARKIGMDAAISIFDRNDNPDGIIISLDADCSIEENYLEEIVSFLKSNPKNMTATINFEHPIKRLSKENPLRPAIVNYELYMRYYRNALLYAGFPHALYTIGSCFAVRAIGYVKQGGMNRKQAGEDFYFLHKMTQIGSVKNISSTTVFPEIRTSGRVPFGTGPTLQAWINGNFENKETYPIELFSILRKWFALIGRMYVEKEIFTGEILFDEFLRQMQFEEKIIELRNNCSNLAIFKSRFFHLFNAFAIIKWLNFSLEKGFARKPLIEEARQLLVLSGYVESAIPDTEEALLYFFRDIDIHGKN